MEAVNVIEDNIDKAIRELKKQTNASGVLREVVERKFFRTRLERRRSKDHRAEERRRTMEKKANRFRRQDA
jgi:ribosomal protein S21